jgi:hypothetical protein
MAIVPPMLFLGETSFYLFHTYILNMVGLGAATTMIEFKNESTGANVSSVSFVYGLL